MGGEGAEREAQTAGLVAFRAAVYDCLTGWGDALFELPARWSARQQANAGHSDPERYFLSLACSAASRSRTARRV